MSFVYSLGLIYVTRGIILLVEVYASFVLLSLIGTTVIAGASLLSFFKESLSVLLILVDRASGLSHWRSAVGILLARSLIVITEISGVAKIILLVEWRRPLLRTDRLFLNSHHRVYSFILAHSYSAFLQVHRLWYVSSWLNSLRFSIWTFASVWVGPVHFRAVSFHRVLLCDKWPRLMCFFHLFGSLFFSFWILAFTKDLSFEVLETYHDYCYIVQGLAIQTIFEHRFNSKTRLLMNSLSRTKFWILLPLVLITGLPNTLKNILIWHFIKNAITSKSDKIMIFLNLELLDLWFSFNDIYVSSSIGQFSFRVSECSRNRKSSRKHPDWSNYVLWVVRFLLCCLIFVIFNRLSCGRLIDLTASFNYSIVFEYVWRLVISA